MKTNAELIDRAGQLRTLMNQAKRELREIRAELIKRRFTSGETEDYQAIMEPRTRVNIDWQGLAHFKLGIIHHQTIKKFTDTTKSSVLVIVAKGEKND
jgi:Na+-translocating ferredoxin:NAD+ oxidoreductase RnfC subunit